MALCILTMPGAFGNSSNYSPVNGSFIRPRIVEEARSLGITATFFHDRDPTRRQAREFIHQNNRPENSILIAGKSIGGVKIYVKVLDEIEVDLVYEKVAVISVDPYGYGYGYQRPREEIVFPAWPLAETPPENIKVVNFHHRNGGFEGATVVAPTNSDINIENVLLDRHSKDFVYDGTTIVREGEEVKHMNMVFHENVRERINAILRFF